MRRGGAARRHASPAGRPTGTHRPGSPRRGRRGPPRRVLTRRAPRTGEGGPARRSDRPPEHDRRRRSPRRGGLQPRGSCRAASAGTRASPLPPPLAPAAGMVPSVSFSARVIARTASANGWPSSTTSARSTVASASSNRPSERSASASVARPAAPTSIALPSSSSSTRAGPARDQHDLGGQHSALGRPRPSPVELAQRRPGPRPSSRARPGSRPPRPHRASSPTSAWATSSRGEGACSARSPLHQRAGVGDPPEEHQRVDHVGHLVGGQSGPDDTEQRRRPLGRGTSFVWLVDAGPDAGQQGPQAGLQRRRKGLDPGPLGQGGHDVRVEDADERAQGADEPGLGAVRARLAGPAQDTRHRRREDVSHRTDPSGTRSCPWARRARASTASPAATALLSPRCSGDLRRSWSPGRAAPCTAPAWLRRGRRRRGCHRGGPPTPRSSA